MAKEVYEFDRKKMNTALLATSGSLLVLDQATVEIERVKPATPIGGLTAICSPNQNDVFFIEPVRFIEAFSQAGTILGIELFPGAEKGELESVNLRFHKLTKPETPVTITVNFRSAENDSNQRERRMLCRFNVVARAEEKIFVDGEIGVTIITPKTSSREVPDIIMPSLTSKQKETGWKNVLEGNAAAIKQACKEGPKPGDLGCE